MVSFAGTDAFDKSVQAVLVALANVDKKNRMTFYPIIIFDCFMHFGSVVIPVFVGSGGWWASVEERVSGGKCGLNLDEPWTKVERYSSILLVTPT